MGAPIRLEAVDALAEFYGEEVTEALYDALGDPDERVRLAAVRGLRQTRSDAAPEALLRALALWPDESAAATKAEALRTLVELDASELPERFALKLVDERTAAPSAGNREALRALLDADLRGPVAARAVAEQVVARLGHEDQRRRANAEAVLGWVAGEATELLIARLEGAGRVSAARLLGASRESQAVEPLVRLLGDPDPDARRAAAWALGQLKDTRAVESLLYATRDSDYSVRETADRALDSMGSAAVIVGLAALVSRALPGGPAKPESPPPTEAELPPPAEAELPWAERVLGRLLGRASGPSE
jgi:HEAT repeat protein